MKLKIRLNPLALSDMIEIKAYIFEDNPEAAIKFGNLLYSKIENLADFPEMGTSLRGKKIKNRGLPTKGIGPGFFIYSGKTSNGINSPWKNL